MTSNLKQEKKHKKLFLLFIPIFAESFLLILFGMVDSLMVSRISDNAVGAVGTASTYFTILYLLFAVISNGLLAVMTQYIGANKKGVAFQARQLAIVLNSAIGITFSLILGIGAKWVVDTLGVSEALRKDATVYIRIVGAGVFIDALTPVFSNYLRAFDKTKFTLISACAGNVVNLCLNTLFLFGFKWGITGVAVATIIGKSVTIALCLIFGHFLIHGLRFEERISRKLLIKQILKIGLPSAIESAGYTIAMAAVMTFLNRMDPSGFHANARSYAAQITSFAYCTAFALSQANVIICGWNIGNGKLKECYPSTLKAALIGIGAGILVELTLALASFGYLGLITKDEKLIKAIRIVLFIDIALEIGRAANLVYGNTLKSTGDSIFPMYVAVPLTLVCAIGGAYLFAVVLKMGVIGAYIALALDECTRGIVMFIRWKTGKWEEKVIVKNNKTEDVLEQ